MMSYFLAVERREKNNAEVEFYLADISIPELDCKRPTCMAEPTDE
jgi:hypothetical protein